MSAGNITPMTLSPPGKQPPLHSQSFSGPISQVLGQSASSQTSQTGIPVVGQQFLSQSHSLQLAHAPAQMVPEQVQPTHAEPQVPAAQQMTAQVASSQLSDDGQPRAPASSANANTGITKTRSMSTSSQQSNTGGGILLARPLQYSTASPIKEQQPQPWPSPPPVRKMSTGPLQRPSSRASNRTVPGAGDYDEEPVLRSPQILAQRRTSTTPLLRPQRSQTQGSPSAAPTRPSADANASSSFDQGSDDVFAVLGNVTIVGEPPSVESIAEESGLISSSPVEMSEPVTPIVVAKDEQVVPAPTETAEEKRALPEAPAPVSLTLQQAQTSLPVRQIVSEQTAAAQSLVDSSLGKLSAALEKARVPDAFLSPRTSFVPQEMPTAVPYERDALVDFISIAPELPAQIATASAATAHDGLVVVPSSADGGVPGVGGRVALSSDLSIAEAQAPLPSVAAAVLATESNVAKEGTQFGPGEALPDEYALSIDEPDEQASASRVALTDVEQAIPVIERLSESIPASTEEPVEEPSVKRTEAGDSLETTIPSMVDDAQGEPVTDSAQEEPVVANQPVAAVEAKTYEEDREPNTQRTAHPAFPPTAEEAQAESAQEESVTVHDSAVVESPPAGSGERVTLFSSPSTVGEHHPVPTNANTAATDEALSTFAEPAVAPSAVQGPSPIEHHVEPATSNNAQHTSLEDDSRTQDHISSTETIAEPTANGETTDGGPDPAARGDADDR